METQGRRSSIGDRIPYLDGLRGIAVAWVVLFHVWYSLAGLRSSAFFHDTPPGRASAYILALGYQGVSLFLVLSGFCLSYRIWERYDAGKANWFLPSEFFARRCIRILPPYFAALALSIAVVMLLGGTVSLADVAAHVALIHNLTPYAESINAPFWSLGLEWQWYLVFPLVLAGCVRMPRAMLLLALLLSIAWFGFAHDLWAEKSLAVRLFEFCCGVVVARWAVSGSRIPLVPAVLGIAVCLVGALLPPIHHGYAWFHAVHTYGLFQPLWGAAFGLLVWLAWSQPAVERMLSMRPLVRLGTISYSVYLMHAPALAVTVRVLDMSSMHPFVLAAGMVVVSLFAGGVFWALVERPCMDGRLHGRYGDSLRLVFHHLDTAWEARPRLNRGVALDT